MKTRVAELITLLMLIAGLGSCRRESTLIYDPQAPYYKAAMFRTLEGQWEYIWQAMDNSYVFWDVDDTDWDALYDEYQEKFKALDVLLDSIQKKYEIGAMPYKDYVRYNKEQMTQIISGDLEPRLEPLLDQHLSICMYNIYEDKENPVYYIQPSALSLRNRPDYHPSVTHRSIIRNDPGYKGIDYIYDGISRHYGVKPDYAREAEDSTYKWAYSCQIENGVYYLRMGSYFLSDLSQYKELSRPIGSFFNNIAEAARCGDLRGIILDNRGNIGGLAADLQTFPGLFISSPVKVLEKKTKNGLGRYDYSAYVDENVEPASESVDIGGIPFVVLQDMNSASMGEISGYACAAAIPSAVIIGERSMGATGSLIADYPDLFHAGPVNYSNKGEEPYIYTSTYSTRLYDRNSGEWKILEKTGIEPDIYCALDYGTLAAGGRDTQLDRAIEYIHGGGILRYCLQTLEKSH